MIKTINFVIDHLDPLGQGVSKRIDKNKQSTITFIPKTLPGEQGSASVVKSAKGVEFAELTTLTKTSSQRISPECEHYAQCSGCDYLHVSYDDELAYKKSALLFLLRSLMINGRAFNDDDIELMPAQERLGYRNRVQLHYRHKYIGLVQASAEKILEVPACRLLRDELRPALEALYSDKSWASSHKGLEGKNKDGHCEIYFKNNMAHIEWDAPYASGGFTQVNEAMNSVLRQWLKQYFSDIKINSLLDLFSGNGNLSDMLLSSIETKRVMVDSTAFEHADFVKQDLYADKALQRFFHRSKVKNVDLLMLDPPRKGFLSIAEWDAFFKPTYIVYVSCNPATLARDLKLLMQSNNKIKILKVALLDMFPSTRHFETVVVLKK